MRKTLAIGIVLLPQSVSSSPKGGRGCISYQDHQHDRSLRCQVPRTHRRALAKVMGQEMGTSINVVNTPGAGGSAGSLNVQNAKVDGYTMLANGMLAFVTMPINGYTDKTYREWDIWIATFAPNAIIVPKNSPYNTIEDLIGAIKANPGKITAGTAGIGSGGHFGAEVIKSIAGAPTSTSPTQVAARP